MLTQHQTRKGATMDLRRDDPPLAGPAPPAAVFFYTRDRTAEHAERHLQGYAGILQADAHAGLNRLYVASRNRSPRPAAGRMTHLENLAGIAKNPLDSSRARAAVVITFKQERALSSAAKATSARLVGTDSAEEVNLAKRRPQYICVVELAVHPLPK